MEFDDAVAYMQGLHRFGIKLGNERFEALMDRLGNPQHKYSVAHITGTKGKGSTTVMVASALQAHGYSVGGYYSPYVFDVRERVQVNGEMIPAADFARIVEQLIPHVDALSATEYGQTTEFELKTAIGFTYFAERKVDYAAVEVGMGGRLDATNIVNPTACVITNIDLDHTQVLGDTHAKIAYEKAGIIKPGVPIITATAVPSALKVIRQIAEERGAPFTVVTPGAPTRRPAAGELHWLEEDGALTIRTTTCDYTGLRLGLRGDYQRANAACAIGALEAISNAQGFELSIDAIREGFANAYLPGRMEIVQRNPTVVMDGAHNPLAARALAAEVQKMPHKRLFLVTGMIAGHEPSGVLDVLAPYATKVFATQPTWFRALPAKEVADAARKHCAEVEIITPPLKAARAALSMAEKDDLVLVTGSFYTVGDVHPEQLIETETPH